jgi:hypothetical protein
MSDFLLSKVIFRHGITAQHVQWAMDLPGAPHNKTLGLARLRMKVMAELTYQLQTFFIRISVEVRVRQLGHRQRCLLDELFKVAQELLVCQRRILDKVCAKQEQTLNPQTSNLFLVESLIFKASLCHFFHCNPSGQGTQLHGVWRISVFTKPDFMGFVYIFQSLCQQTHIHIQSSSITQI